MCKSQDTMMAAGGDRKGLEAVREELPRQREGLIGDRDLQGWKRRSGTDHSDPQAATRHT